MVTLQKIVSIVAIFLLTVSVSSAQIASCPINEAPFLSVVNEAVVQVVSEGWGGQVVITNPTTYILPDLRIGVGMYLKGSDEQPKYWITVPNRYSVRPGETELINLEIGTTHVPAGEYHLKFFVAQGDDFSPLGNALQKVAAPVVTIKKDVPPESPLTATLTTEGGEVDETPVSPLLVAATITNGSLQYLLDDTLLEVRVGKGISPVGTSVVTREEVKQRIFPGNSRTTSVTAEFLEPGTYTAVALLRGGSELLPIAITRKTIGDSPSTYLPVSMSLIGITEYPIGEPVEAVACVVVVPSGEEALQSYDLTSQRLVFRANTGETEIASVTGDVAIGGDVRTFGSSLLINGGQSEVTLVADVFENRFGKDELIETRTVTLNCDTFERCDEIKPVPEAPKNIPAPLSPIVFVYIVLFLVAILIGYVALRKQPREVTDKNT